MTNKPELLPQSSELHFYPSSAPSYPPPAYPNLNEMNDAKITEPSSTYRITHIMDVKKSLDKEFTNREGFKKRYQKIDKSLFGLECTCMVSELALAGSSVAFPLLIPFATPACLGLTAVTMILRNGSKIITKKIDKHNTIATLAKSKLSSIREKYSHAIEDGIISESEFNDIVKEIESYENLKKEILSNFHTGSSELTKDVEFALLMKGKEEGKQQMKHEMKQKLKSLDE
jgi:hypothetical protein